jgi:hypothetical protein
VSVDAAIAPDMSTEVENLEAEEYAGFSIKALTIHQPWAALLAYGDKRYETRSWSTAFRGRIAIHAGVSQQGMQWLSHDRRDPSAGIIRNLINTSPEYTKSARTLGAIIAVGRLSAIYRSEAMRDHISEQEKLLGDYRDRRFGWEISDVVILPHPVNFSGKQGLWEWTPTLSEAAMLAELLRESDGGE